MVLKPFLGIHRHQSGPGQEDKNSNNNILNQHKLYLKKSYKMAPQNLQQILYKQEGNIGPNGQIRLVLNMPSNDYKEFKDELQHYGDVKMGPLSRQLKLTNILSMHCWLCQICRVPAYTKIGLQIFTTKHIPSLKYILK